MPPSMVALLAAVGTAMSALVALAHCDVVLMIIAAVAGAATGSAACFALTPIKNIRTRTLRTTSARRIGYFVL